LTRSMASLVARKLKAAFVTVSGSMIPVAAKYFGIDEERFQCISNGIDLNKFRSVKNIPGHPPTIVMIGTLCRNKGQILGIEAFKGLVKLIPNVRLKLVGDGPDRDALVDSVKVNTLTGRVEFAGLRDDVPEIMAASDIIWQLSQSEALPVVVLEAMATGVPVVGFDVRGIRDAVADGQTGTLVPYGDTDAVAKATVRILTDQTLYQSFSSRARQRAAEFFSLGNMVDGHEKVLIRVNQSNS
jgi:glycosyltransferase involved in cell wall biosynthesis